ncbi:integrin alpha-X-like [Python bivittatus]|uniref:Integrin alpha-X-like n=1 Tax=Python bivittatus TaxID=176946 RepID=A0A9F5N1S8_PYTBI|nr:integrin alpha-X-like [Python bivittatus]
MGKFYQCTYPFGDCKEISIQRPRDAFNMSLGLSLVAQNDQVLVCGPTVHRACGKNMYINGYCFLLDQNLQEKEHFPESLPECTPHTTDIVFLIDGSSSIQKKDFETMKKFVSEVIENLSGRDTQFALMQFSGNFKEHFNFNSQDPARLVMEVKQLHGWTKTATAIRKVVRELFIPEKGSRNGAAKILIVITDGSKKNDPAQYWQVIPEAEQAGIIRYAIGVGSAFSTTKVQQELKDIASEPDDEHVFKVNNFNALKSIQDQLQNKIFAIEGTQFQSSSSFQMEMSQEGLSALLIPKGPVLGAVGAYDWSGGVILYQTSNRDPQFINISSNFKDMNNSYLGYSSQSVQFNGRNGLVVGAPRYDHIGKVVYFENEALSREWQLKMEVVGEQVGSYFGATLCSVDLNQDSITDLVLVGAPMYYDAIAGGRVHICLFKNEAFSCTDGNTALKGQPGHMFGRFGASIAEVGDITGDKWTDVAIGAPLENENTGAVYIFSGERASIKPSYVQRIEGQKFSGGFFYFGQAISGGTDLTGDGLKDIIVGQQGRVFLMRSRPVLQVKVSIMFHPPSIPASVFQWNRPTSQEYVTSMAEVCFTVSKTTQDDLDEIYSELWYSLTLDSHRTNARASFNSKSPILQASVSTGLERKCQNHLIELPVGTEDTVTPITLGLNYNLTGKSITKVPDLLPILSKHSKRNYTAELPFEKNCGSDGKCEDILQTSFNFSGLETLDVGLTSEFSITASLQNHGEDSYHSTLCFFYPAGLSYRKVTLLQQASRKVTRVQCRSAPASEEEASQNATCSVNHPIFWSGAEAIFVATFDVSPNVDLGDTLQIMIKADSENGGTTIKDTRYEATLPVRYAVYLLINMVDESTKYVNFTAGQEEARKSVEHRYEVKNLRKRNIPFMVTFQIPVELKGIPVWNMFQVIPSEPEVAKCDLERETPGSKDLLAEEANPQLDCSVASCKIIRCDILSLKIQENPLEFRIKGDINFHWTSQIQQKKIILVSSAQISYDTKKYTQEEGLSQIQMQTIVERIEIYNSLPVIMGSSFGGLILLVLIAAALYKVGFFKRQYKQMLEEAGAENEAVGPSSQNLESSPPNKDIVS